MSVSPGDGGRSLLDLISRTMGGLPEKECGPPTPGGTAERQDTLIAWEGGAQYGTCGRIRANRGEG